MMSDRMRPPERSCVSVIEWLTSLCGALADGAGAKTPSHSTTATTALMGIIACVLVHGGCTCVTSSPPPVRRAPLACVPQHPTHPTVVAAGSATETVAAGSLSAAFSVTSTGEAQLVLPLRAPPGRGGIEPRLALTYRSSGGDGVLGAGFSLAGLSAITRCPRNLEQDGEIRRVRHDGSDKLCLDGTPLVVTSQSPGLIEYRTVPDIHSKVLGHEPDEDGTPGWFEVIAPSGVATEYGTSAGSRPRGPGGTTRAWLAEVVRDGRGNALSYGYCFADAGDYTAEYALDEIRYTRFDGSPALEASRAVKLVLGVKEPAVARSLYSDGMELQSSLRVDAIDMVGPAEELVRRYALTYSENPTTSRTLLTAIKECSREGVCLPPTRFEYQHREGGFQQQVTSLPTPVARNASPMLFDLDGDGLDDLVVPDMDPALGTPGNPITRWLVAHNGGPGASPILGPTTLAFSQEGAFVEPSGPADAALLQPELGTVIDYDQDGRKDILLHDVHGESLTWQVLLAQPDRTFELHDTGIPRPFPLGSSPVPPGLTSRGGSMHLADVDGDRVPDLIQCEDHGATPDGDPGKAVWTAHLWRPGQGGAGAGTSGFDLDGEAIAPLATMRCDLPLFTVDLDADGKVDLVVQSLWAGDDGSERASATYDVLSRREDGTWTARDTQLPAVPPEGRVVFLDVNGDGLPDAVEAGFQNHALYTYFNNGTTFETMPVYSLGSAGLGDQDTFFRLAVTLDANGDGRQDLLMPVPAGTLPGQSTVRPAWALLQAISGFHRDATFSVTAAGVPFEAALGEAITLADPHGPRIGDLHGDGAPDIVIPLGGVFHVFENLAADPDVVVAVSDGMNARDPDEPGHVANVSLSYGHLVDGSITNSVASQDPALEEALYLSHAEPANDCVYPRRCVVGPRRVVSGYSENDGSDGARRFAVRYRDGRHHAHGLGFLGFAERVVVDLDTLAGTVDRYDNITYEKDLHAFPLAGQRTAQWRYSPGLPEQAAPERVEMAFLDTAYSVVPTSDAKSYFALPTGSRLRRAQGDHSPGAAAPTLLSFVRSVQSAGPGAAVLRDTTSMVTDFDAFGNVRAEEIATAGVDLTLEIERTFENDTDRWVLGQLKTQTTCSTAALVSQCRTLTRTTTIYGEVDTESIETDDGSPETQLDVVYARDAYGNVTGITASDAFGHLRTTTILYEPEGIFPDELIDAAGHTTLPEFDTGFGVLTRETDPNGLVTEWRYDGFGRLGLEILPDGTRTTFTLSRTKGASVAEDGSAGEDTWRVRRRTTTTAGADDEVELDGLGRPRRWWWHGPATPRPTGEPPRLVQEVAYDPRSGKVARRSVPASEDAPASELLFDVFEHDSVGREIRHTTPWSAVTETSYEGLFVQVTDPLGHVTLAESDPLGRPVAVTDAIGGVTSYTYGPFGLLYTVTDPGGALSRTTRDALGRAREVEEPDRGTTALVHDGFGELLSSTDALGRVITFERDALARLTSRIDQKGAEVVTTTWAWDTAEHGLGKLHRVTSPDGEKTYSYDPLGRVETLALAVTGESETLRGELDYDGHGRVTAITYPTPAGAPPFVVAHEHDPYGHVLKVRDAETDLVYWQLTDVDDAGRFRTEVLGNGVTTERTWFADKQRLRGIVTESSAEAVQRLAYDYDARLDPTSRTDELQPQHSTERFRYDPLERLTCAYFSAQEDAAAPCASSYEYAPNGNLTFKSDVGSLLYGDPAHPHAVTAAGGGVYGYDAVGDQTARPGGVSVSHTPFDLPRTLTQGGTVVTFGYDGDEKRIRKTTPEAETLYFADWYERVTQMGSGVTEHRHYIHSPERVVAIVTRGGPAPGVLYVHVDHLGSVDALTDGTGAVAERRSYDAFGQRRNPQWGEPPPGPFGQKTTLGFTGHESDTELGLVNMKGRVFDPKLGRFLTPDPVIADLYFAQSLNPYSYVLNNPLTFVDPSGFSGDPERPPILPIREETTRAPGGLIDVHLYYPPRVGAPLPPEEPAEAVQVGETAPPTDVDTTGSSPEPTAQPATTAPESWTQNPYVQIEGGFFGGLFLGLVPFGGVGHQVLDGGGVLPRGTPEAHLGLAVGQVVGGIFTLVGGVTGEVLGGLTSATGVGAAVGVPAMVVSTTLVVGGAANIWAGLRGLSQSLMSAEQGAGSGSGPNAAPPEKGGGKPTSKIDRATFKAEREAFWKAEAKNNPSKYSEEDLARMKMGRAPKGPDGHPMELHHVHRTPEGGVKPLSRTDHRLGENYKKNHQ
jgi:RHS repeat-associated protein